MDEPWSFIATSFTSLCGGGLIVGILNWRLAKKRGVREDDREDGSSAVTQMNIIAKAQIENLVNPMKEDMAKLRERLEALEKEVEEQKSRYWKAIGFARTLLFWVERTFPGHGHIVPQPAEIIRNDIEIS